MRALRRSYPSSYGMAHRWPDNMRRTFVMRLRTPVRGIGMLTSAVVVMSLAAAGPSAAEPNAGGSARVANNTLVIFGTRGNDAVVVTQSADPNQLLVDIGGDNTFDQFDRSTFTAIDVVLGDGDDSFQESPGVVSDEKLTVQAGAGDDQIQTGDG